ncbi:hypothetical protein, partial [Gilliamella sp. Lep-s35]|uniref:hypothetical protein n=1 Tax=Gilliamella sp. Lep-s35 TaxID=2687312 RepID=UPI001365CE01
MVLVMAETCRYSIPVKINVFPDIKRALLICFNFNENDFRNYIEKEEYNLNTYLIITEINSSGEFQLAVTGKIGIKPHIGTDKDGIYMTTQLYSDGLTFYLKVESEFKLVFFGFTIIDWNFDYEPKPYTCGKYQADAVKYYFNNPDKNVQYW